MKKQPLPKYMKTGASDRILTKAEIKARFDQETASVYSQKDPVHLPEYSTALSALTEGIAEGLSSWPLILDLGAGTGNLSKRILARFPGSQVTLVDFSQNMLNETSVVLAEYPDRFTVFAHDMFTVQFPAQTFDAVVSSFAIHHARGRQAYLALYKKIHYWLKPNGIFSCCDVVDGDTPGWTALNESGWRGHLEMHYDREQIDRLFDNYRIEDTPLSLFNHLSCLKEAGFAHADVLWKKFNFAVYCGKASQG
jgi:tRNA (cmo5U34)-methyltransferase